MEFDKNLELLMGFPRLLAKGVRTNVQLYEEVVNKTVQSFLTACLFPAIVARHARHEPDPRYT